MEVEIEVIKKKDEDEWTIYIDRRREGWIRKDEDGSIHITVWSEKIREITIYNKHTRGK